MFKSLFFYKKETNFGEIDFFCPTLTCLAVPVTATFSDFFDASTIETLVIAVFIILQLSIGYWT